MGWIDFANNTSLGKLLSRTATSAVNSVDSVVQDGFQKAEAKIDRMSTSAEKVGGGIDNIHKTVNNGFIDRYVVEDTCKDIKDIYEGSKELEKEIEDLKKIVPKSK